LICKEVGTEMPLVMFVVMFVLNVCQLAAAQAGLEEWWGIPGWMAFMVGFFALIIGGPAAGLAVSVAGFFAAMQVWHWEWWQAALLCFPTLILGIGLMLFQGAAVGIGSLLSNRRREY
jgi:hypothetical protein